MKSVTAAASVFVLSTLNSAGCDGGSGAVAGSGGTYSSGGSSSSTIQQGGSSSAGGSSSTGGSANSADQQSGGSSANTEALAIDSTGRVEKASNRFSIQGSWYWYADFSDAHAGLTKLTGAQDNAPPYVDGKGMCVTGTTPGGASDNYVTWGAGIGLNLNQGTEEDGGTTPQKLSPAPNCYAITLSADSTAPGGILGKLLEANPMPGTTADPNVPQEAPSIALKAGQTTDVCASKVKQPSWCTASSHKPGDCAEPSNLEQGITGVQIQALAGASGGNINVCVVSIVPKD